MTTTKVTKEELEAIISRSGKFESPTWEVPLLPEDAIFVQAAGVDPSHEDDERIYFDLTPEDVAQVIDYLASQSDDAGAVEFNRDVISALGLEGRYLIVS